MADYAEIWRDEQGEWRGHVCAGNSEVIFPTESYKNRDDLVDLLLSRFPEISVLEIEPDE